MSIFGANELNSSWRGFWLVSTDDAGLQFAINLDFVKSESWNLGQETPEFAVANVKVNAQRIVQNELFRVTCEVTETPFLGDNTIYARLDDTATVVPGDLTGESRVLAVRNAFREHIADIWSLYTSRHGLLERMVLTSVDVNIDGPARKAEVVMAFSQYNAANVEVIAVQRSVRAKKTATTDEAANTTTADVTNVEPAIPEDVEWLRVRGRRPPTTPPVRYVTRWSTSF